MRRCLPLLGMLAFALLLGLGCAAPGEKGQWDDFWKDLRGDNMRMRSGIEALREPSASIKSPE